MLWIRIGFYADPDPAVYLNADQDPDPGDQNNADPGGSGSWSLFAVKKFKFLHKKLYFM